MGMSIWDDPELHPDREKAAVLKARASLLSALNDEIERWNVTQDEVAKRLGVHRPRVSELVNGKLSKFNFEMLFTLAMRAGIDPQIVVAPPSETRRVSKPLKAKAAKRPTRTAAGAHADAP